ncbi:MAG: O-antigen ligase family protein [Endomicrobiales bacterium]|nr:O-antigen ligase family protein [Endomicrobiales bacterium]
MSNTLIYLLIGLIPFQFYCTFYKTLSISAAQILAIIVIAIAIVSLIRNKAKYEKSTMDYCVLGLIIVMFCSILFAHDRMTSVKYFLKWASFILLFFAVKVAVTRKEIIKKTLKVALITGFVVSVIGIIEYEIGVEKMYYMVNTSKLMPVVMEPDTLKDLSSTDSLNWTQWKDGKRHLRVPSTFENVIDFSAYLGLMLPFFLLALNYSGRPVRLIYMIFMTTMLIALFLTFTRSAYIALGLMSVVMLVFSLTKTKNRRNALIFVFVCLISMGFIMGTKGTSGLVRERFSDFIKKQDRVPFWTNGLKIFIARPLLGVGIANYGTGLEKHAGNDAPRSPAHNQYITMAAETGIAGLVVYLLILYFGFRYSYLIFDRSEGEEEKLIGLGFLGMWTWYSFQTMFSDHFFSDKFGMMFWLMVGLNAKLYELTVAKKDAIMHGNEGGVKV